MKVLSAAAQQAITTYRGVEPITLIKVEVGGAIGNLYFADRNINLAGAIYAGKATIIGHVTSVRSQNNATVNSLAVTIIDSDLSLYKILNKAVLCNKKVTVYEHFVGLAASDAIPILIGELSTPFSWKEQDRTLSFEINTKIRALQAGYQPVTNIVQVDIIGKAMPLCYGTVFDIPCQVLVKPRQAKLFDDVLYNDGGSLIIGGSTNFRVDYNKDWPDNVLMTIMIGTIKIYGYWTGNVFNIQTRQYAQYKYLGYDPKDAHNVYVTLTTQNAVGSQIGIMQGAQYGGPTYYMQKYYVHAQTTAVVDGATITVLNLNSPIAQDSAAVDDGLRPPIFGTFFTELPSGLPYIFKAGSIVYQQGFTETVYCCNAIPSTKILATAAFKVLGPGERALVQLPDQYFTANLDYSFDGQHLTTITLPQPLSYYAQGWESETLYVSLISSVGPNTADIISDIVTRYTVLSVDAASFKLVHDAIDKYPSDFAIFDSKDALTFIGEICWQARCSYLISDQTVFLRYLSVEPASSITFNDDDTLEATFELGYTKFEDIVTQLIAKYVTGYDPERVTQQLVYNNNQNVFGLRRQTYDFFIYTNQALVQKTLTFWGNRLSNQWVELNLKTALKGMVCDLFDCALLQVNAFNTKAIVDEASYDTLSHEVNFRFWTPILAGGAIGTAWLSDVLDIKPPAPTPPNLNQLAVLISLPGINTSQPNTQGIGDALPGIIVGINTDGTFYADIYENGYNFPPTETSVLVNLLDRRYKHKIGSKVLCVRIGKTYYDSDSTIPGNVFLAKVTSADNDKQVYVATLYRNSFDSDPDAPDVGVSINTLDTSLTLNVDQEISVVEVTLSDGSFAYWCLSSKSAGDLIVGGDKDTAVKDGVANTADGALSDVFVVKSGRLYLNVDAIGLIDNTGSVAELSDLLRIVGSLPCIWSDAEYTADGTTKAQQELVIDPEDTTKFRPASTLLKD